jgi:hypothetical protein
MNWHHKREHGPTRPAVDLDPIVYDIYGVPVGVRAPGARSPESETRASRHLARITALRATRELEGREWITLGLF